MTAFTTFREWVLADQQETAEHFLRHQTLGIPDGDALQYGEVRSAYILDDQVCVRLYLAEASLETPVPLDKVQPHPSTTRHLEWVRAVGAQQEDPAHPLTGRRVELAGPAHGTVKHVAHAEHEGQRITRVHVLGDDGEQWPGLDLNMTDLA